MAFEVLYDSSLLPQCEILGISVLEQGLCGVVNDCPLRFRSPIQTDNIDMFAGDDRQLRFFAKDQDGDPVDLTGAIVLLTVKELSSDASPLFTKSTAVDGEGLIGTADDGEAFLFLVPADTSSLIDGGQYVWDISVTLSSGKKFTALTGVLNILLRGERDNIDVYKGDDRDLSFFARDPNLNVVDLTGATITMTVFDGDDVAVITKAGTIVTATDGEGLFTLVPVDTSSLDINQYSWKVVVVRSSKTYTSASGVLNLLLPIA